MAGKQVACDCGKTITSPTDAELIRDVQAHAQSVHQLSLTPEQILSMAQPV